jgi:prepilin-type N-terminal cleavage/methylation domain-containing protein
MGAGVLMAARSARAGFSLVEVMVALVILTIVVTGLAGTTVAFQHQMSIGEIQARATAVANSQMAQVRAYPDYTQLSSFAGNQTNYPVTGWSVLTQVNRDTAAVTDCVNTPCPNNDITYVMVSVTAPGLMAPIALSYAIAP